MPQLEKTHETSPSTRDEARFPALCAEQFHVPNQTFKEPQFALWNYRDTQRTLSQDEKNSDVTSGTQNSSMYLETGVSGNLCSFLKEVKPLVLYDVEHRTAMEPMKGKWASSRVDLGYTELFCIPEETAVFLSSSDSGLGDSLVFHQAH